MTFFIWVFFHEYSRFTGQQGKGEAIFLTPLYHFILLYKHLKILAGRLLQRAYPRTVLGQLPQGKLPSNPNSAHNPKPNPEPKVGAVVRTPPTYSWQLDSQKREPLVSKCKSLTIKLFQNLRFYEPLMCFYEALLKTGFFPVLSGHTVF